MNRDFLFIIAIVAAVLIGATYSWVWGIIVALGICIARLEQQTRILQDRVFNLEDARRDPDET
jgi:divalent metal cation (Fe/Co/Zn/Cd) transporter